MSSRAQTCLWILAAALAAGNLPAPVRAQSPELPGSYPPPDSYGSQPLPGSYGSQPLPYGSQPLPGSPSFLTNEPPPGPPAGEFNPIAPVPPGHSFLPIPGTFYGDDWSWLVLPDGLIYRSYLAGAREPRFGSVLFYEKDQGWLWDVALGGRVGLLRYGTLDAFRPQGWQLDMEGAVFPRLDLEYSQELVSSDFRFGVPLTYGYGPVQWKFAYAHESSHAGDDFLLANPGVTPVHYLRNALVLGVGYFWTPDLRLYAETSWSFISEGAAEPWEFQFGIDYSPLACTGFQGMPFAAINVHLREEVDFGGNLVVQAGWQWRGSNSGRMRRVGLQYLNGKSNQYQFFNESEQQLGLGLWFDY